MPFVKCLSRFAEGIVPGATLVLRWRNRAIVIAESLARAIAAIRSTSVCWQSYLCSKNTEISPQLRFEKLAVISLFKTQKLVLSCDSNRAIDSFDIAFHVKLRNGLRELTAFGERSIGSFANLSPGPSPMLHARVPKKLNLVAKCLPGCAQGPCQGQPLSPAKKMPLKRTWY